jgi:hypothetical protein
MATASTAAPAAAPAAPATAPTPVRIPASIVPLKGLPFVAIALIGLVVAIGTNSVWALNFFHVAGGGIWTALDLFLGLVLGPMVLARMSPPARAELTARLMPKLLLIFPTVVTMTLGSGFQLARHFGFLYTDYPRHGWIVASFIVVGIMAVIAIGILEPANLAVLFEMRKPEPDYALVGKLMRRFIYVAGITGAMQIVTLLIMTKLPT